MCASVLLLRTPIVAPAHRRSAQQLFLRNRCDNAPAEVSFGTVKWFDVKKGFGFITPEAGGPDVFVHQSEVHSPGFRSLADGEEVEFKLVTQDDGRFRAADVTGPEGNYVRGAPAPELPNMDM